MPKNPMEIILPKYKPGDLLLKVSKASSYFFDHVIILKSYRDVYEYIYEIYTSDGSIEKRTVEWVDSLYEEPKDETTKIYSKMDS